MKSKVVPLRIPENLLDLISLYSQEQRADKATTMRQWLYRGAEEFTLRLVEEGRISASRAAELLDVSIYDIYRLAEKHGMTIGSTKEQYEESMKNAINFQE